MLKENSKHPNLVPRIGYKMEDASYKMLVTVILKMLLSCWKIFVFQSSKEKKLELLEELAVANQP